MLKYKNRRKVLFFTSCGASSGFMKATKEFGHHKHRHIVPCQASGTELLVENIYRLNVFNYCILDA